MNGKCDRKVDMPPILDHLAKEGYVNEKLCYCSFQVTWAISAECNKMIFQLTHKVGKRISAFSYSSLNISHLQRSSCRYLTIVGNCLVLTRVG